MDLWEREGVRLQAEVCMDCAQGFPLVVLPNKAVINSKMF